MHGDHLTTVLVSPEFDDSPHLLVVGGGWVPFDVDLESLVVRRDAVPMLDFTGGPYPRGGARSRGVFGGELYSGTWILTLWCLPTDAMARATEDVKGAFPTPQPPGVALPRSLQARAAWVRWREEGGRPSPYFPLVQGQALLHAEDIGTVEWGAIVPDTACRWVTAAAPQPMRSLPACHRLLRAVLPLAPRHALTRDVWRAMLSQPREWLATPGARYPPGPVLNKLTAPTPGVRHVLHKGSTPTEQLTDEVLDLALEPLGVLYRQAHLPPAGRSNHLARLGLQRRVGAAHAGGLVEQWLALHNLSRAQGPWYLHQLFFLPGGARRHCQQDPYHT